MQFEKNDQILLLGEANFSFGLSLISYYNQCLNLNCSFTMTCYENEEEALKKYGTEINANLNKLQKIANNKVLFGVDACNLDVCFDKEYKFDKIVFMFPHVSGRSNLKKNRLLIENFFKSSVGFLKASKDSRSCIYLGLAKGQGGTSFEHDPSKRNNKDSWRVNEIAQICGLILTDCSKFSPEKLSFYKSTGFRSQNKSFQTDSGLIHKFELSLPFRHSIRHSKEQDNESEPLLLNFFSNYIQNAQILILNDHLFASNETNQYIHPIIELKYLIGKHLKSKIDLDINHISDCEDLFYVEYPADKSHYKLDTTLMKLLFNQTKAKDDQNYNYMIRNSIKDIHLHNENKFKNLIKSDCLNVISGLVLKRKKYDFKDFREHEIANMKYEIMIHSSFDDELSFQKKRDAFKSEILDFFQRLFNQQDEFILRAKDESIAKIEIFLNEKEIAEITLAHKQLTCIIYADYILVCLFNLHDNRLLYSDDLRIFTNTNESTQRFRCCIRPFSIETNKWLHDISFWYLKDMFNFEHFLDCVYDTCFDLVKSIQLIDSYTRDDGDQYDQFKSSFCFRLLYESCDRALSWNQTTEIQNNLRKKLAAKMPIKLK